VQAATKAPESVFRPDPYQVSGHREIIDSRGSIAVLHGAHAILGAGVHGPPGYRPGGRASDPPGRLRFSPRTIHTLDAGPARRFQTIKARWPTVDLPQPGEGEAVISYPLWGGLRDRLPVYPHRGGPEAPEADLDGRQTVGQRLKAGRENQIEPIAGMRLSAPESTNSSRGDPE